MGEIQFFYSAGGRDVYGPVTKEMLLDLLRQNAIDSSYYFCPEGATEWQPISPEALEAEAEASVTEVPPAEAGPSFVARHLDDFWSSWVDVMESISIRFILYAICVVVPPLLSFILTAHFALSLPPTEHSETRILPVAGYFLSIVAAIYLGVYLIGLPISKTYRLWLRASVMLLLAVFVVMGWIR